MTHIQGMLFWPSPGLNSVASLAVCWTAPCYRLGWDRNRKGTLPAPGKTALLWSPVLVPCWRGSTLHKSHQRWSLILPSWNHRTTIKSFYSKLKGTEKNSLYNRRFGVLILKCNTKKGFQFTLTYHMYLRYLHLRYHNLTECNSTFITIDKTIFLLCNEMYELFNQDKS